ncbi:MAG: HIT family protein [Proteobacteria bacterium]|nr:HIT family protein [Pseudomonadota bacterium]
MDCIFCKIINGSIPSAKVYEDGDFVAVMDINPVSKGHLLVLPKKHYVNMMDMDEEILKKTGIVLKKLCGAITKALGVSGVNLIQNNGIDAGQIIFHSHFHLIPRRPNDGIKIGMEHRKYEEGEMEEYANKIKNAV